MILKPACSYQTISEVKKSGVSFLSFFDFKFDYRNSTLLTQEELTVLMRFGPILVLFNDIFLSSTDIYIQAT